MTKRTHFLTVDERLEHYVDSAHDPDDCWPWVGTLSLGYGRVRTPDGMRPAHRVMYERRFGPVPEGFVLDHRCHTDDDSCVSGATCQHRRCCNPAHMEPVTGTENTRRGLASNRKRGVCRSGRHDVSDPAAWHVYPSGRRICAACKREATGAWNATAPARRLAARSLAAR